MDFGFSIPTRGTLATREAALAMAQRGEACGFDYLAIPDHIVIPHKIDSPYPYNAQRKMVGASDGDCMEQLVLMAFLAAATSRIRLLTSVMVVPHRPVMLTAKALATIDVLSQGRVTVGCGVGWMEEEFVAIGAPPFAERGRVTDAYLRAFKALWTEDEPRADGPHARFSNIAFLPKPIQRPHPPLWIGGESPAALRRVIALGDAWYPLGANPDFPLDTLARYRTAVEGLKESAQRAGRDPATIALAYWAPWYDESRPARGIDGERQLFTGSDDEVASDIEAFDAIGVRHLLFSFVRPTLAASLAAVERFASKVLPKVRG